MQQVQVSPIEESIEIELVDKFEKSSVYYFIKRLVDIIGSICGLIIFSPIFIIISILIKSDSKGPIFFSQDRVGKDSELFKMYKFRSMCLDAECMLDNLRCKNEMSGPMFKIKEDPRITKIGRFIRKTSIDEFPQLFNVLIGDMSLVGPRPNLPNEVKDFTLYQKQKLKVKPGITCYWQVMGRNSIDFEDWMKLDVKYVNDRSTLLDISLILKTALLIFGDKNAS